MAWPSAMTVRMEKNVWIQKIYVHTLRHAGIFNAECLNFDFKAFLRMLAFETLSSLIFQGSLFGDVILNKVLLELVNACSLLYFAWVPLRCYNCAVVICIVVEVFRDWSRCSLFSLAAFTGPFHLLRRWDGFLLLYVMVWLLNHDPTFHVLEHSNWEERILVTKVQLLNRKWFIQKCLWPPLRNRWNSNVPVFSHQRTKWGLLYIVMINTSCLDSCY